MSGTPASSAEFAQAAAACTSPEQQAQILARWILGEADRFYAEFSAIPQLAKQAFERRDHPESLRLSSRRLSLYSLSIDSVGTEVRQVLTDTADLEALWPRVEHYYLPLIRNRYSADVGTAFFHSIRRKVYQGEWKPVAYSFGKQVDSSPQSDEEVSRHFALDGCLRPETVCEMFAIPRLEVAFRDPDADARAVAERINQRFTSPHDGVFGVRSIDMISAGFFRNRGAYLVGRLNLADERVLPFILALLNDPDGVFVDAVLHSETYAHNIFSSTLANFHVTNAYYHELTGFLHSIMPRRPLGLHYSTIGFNHLGKVAVMNDLRREIQTSGETLRTSVGFPGTVAMGFSSPSSAYNLKVIRDQPTAQYKWGEFEGIENVLKKYARVHEINRTGSMLDNVIYYNVKLAVAWFDPALLEELLDQAGRSVSARGDALIFKYLIVQRRLTPLPVYLDNATAAQAETAAVNLGYCIKNNAAANIFNRDLDGRNYGVSRFSKVYLFDYDALEPFTEVKIRSNADRVDGEEDVPDWYFEDGVVFLPEEIETGLRFKERRLRRAFRAVHGDLLTVEYWQRIQRQLIDGVVPGVSVYPENQRLTVGDATPSVR